MIGKHLGLKEEKKKKRKLVKRVIKDGVVISSSPN